MEGEIEQLRKRLNYALADYQHTERSVREERKELREVRQRVRNTILAQQMLQQVAESVQTLAHGRIASVVTRCLKAVFGEEEAYEFKIIFERKRGKTEAKLSFVRDGHEIDPVDAAGGGVLDIAAFSLRLACLMLAKPQGRKLLVLDEPMRFVSREYRPRVRELLETLATEFGVQIIMVTHSAELVCGKVVEL